VARVWLSDIIIGLFPNKKRRNHVQKFRDGGLAGGGALTNRGSQGLSPKRNRGRGDPTDLNIKKERDFGSLKQSKTGDWRVWPVFAVFKSHRHSWGGGGGGLVSVEATFTQSRGMGRKEGEQGGGGIAVPGMANEGWR